MTTEPEWIKQIEAELDAQASRSVQTNDVQPSPLAEIKNAIAVLAALLDRNPIASWVRGQATNVSIYVLSDRIVHCLAGQTDPDPRRGDPGGGELVRTCSYTSYSIRPTDFYEFRVTRKHVLDSDALTRQWDFWIGGVKLMHLEFAEPAKGVRDEPDELAESFAKHLAREIDRVRRGDDPRETRGWDD